MYSSILVANYEGQELDFVKCNCYQKFTIVVWKLVVELSLMGEFGPSTNGIGHLDTFLFKEDFYLWYLASTLSG